MPMTPALLAESEAALQVLVDAVQKSGSEKGLHMNVKKTKAMVVSRQSNVRVNIRVNGQMLKQVHRYLGQWISDDGKC